LPTDPDVLADKDDQSVTATIQTPIVPVIADGLFAHKTAPFNATWQTDLLLPNINCSRCTLQVIEFMAEHGPNPGGGYFYHQCADLLFFSGSAGFSSVPDSKRLRKFSVPVRSAIGTATGIALMGLGQNQTIQLELRSRQGNALARANLSMGPRQHIAKFVDQFAWNQPVDFSDFSGHLIVTGSSDLAATAILITPSGSAAVPVAEIP
jgi:hypothetical protein